MTAPLRMREMPILAGTLPGRAPEPAFFPAERLILVRSVMEALLGEPAAIMIRGAPGVGKTTVADVLHGRLAGLHWRVIRPIAGRHGPLDVQRMVGEAFEVAAADRMTPGELAGAVEAVPAGPVAAVILDDAECLPASMFHYLSLILALLNRRGKRLNVVFVGALGRWRGLDPEYLGSLRRAARNYTVPEFTDRQAAEYLQHCRAADGVPPGQGLTRRAVAKLLDQADGLPGRLDALLVTALQRQSRRRRTWRSAVRVGSAMGIAVAASFVLGLNLPRLLDHRLLDRGLHGLTAMVSAGPGLLAAHATARASPANPPGMPPETAYVPAAWLATAVPPPSGSLIAAEPAAAAPAAPSLAVAPAPDPAPPAPAVSAVVPLPPVAVTARATADAPSVIAPPSMRKGFGLALIAQPGDTLISLYAKVYHGVTAPPYAEVAAANHLPLKAGAVVVFPTPPDGWSMR